MASKYDRYWIDVPLVAWLGLSGAILMWLSTYSSDVRVALSSILLCWFFAFMMTDGMASTDALIEHMKWMDAFEARQAERAAVKLQVEEAIDEI